MNGSCMYEVEQKYRVGEIDALTAALAAIGAVEQDAQTHRDTYFNHPCRDFAETREALRVRRVDGKPMVTYKGSPLPGQIKARTELEWPLSPGDPEGEHFEKLLTELGFRHVATIAKRRRPFEIPSRPNVQCVVIDVVESLGVFAEIELLVRDSLEVDAARKEIKKLAAELTLDDAEPRSYLTMWLES